MGLFSRKKPSEYNEWEAAGARQMVPVWYRDRWREELDDQESLYSHRASRIDEAIRRCEDADPSDAMDAARQVMPDAASAMQFTEDVAQGRSDELRGRVVIEAHRDIYADALGKHLNDRSLQEGQILRDDTEDVMLQAACLAHVRDLIPDAPWSGLRAVLDTSSTRHVFAQVLPD